MSSAKWFACALVMACVAVRQTESAPAPQEDSPPMPVSIFKKMILEQKENGYLEKAMG